MPLYFITFETILASTIFINHFSHCPLFLNSFPFRISLTQFSQNYFGLPPPLDMFILPSYITFTVWSVCNCCIVKSLFCTQSLSFILVLCLPFPLPNHFYISINMPNNYFHRGQKVFYKAIFVSFDIFFFFSKKTINYRHFLPAPAFINFHQWFLAMHLCIICNYSVHFSCHIRLLWFLIINFQMQTVCCINQFKRICSAFDNISNMVTSPCKTIRIFISPNNTHYHQHNNYLTIYP